MAQTIGPLLSVAASGKFGEIMEFRTGGGVTHAIPIRRVPKTRSPAQKNQAARFKTASTAWQSLTTLQKAAWNTAAQGTDKIGYRLYLSEYLNQGITPPSQPTIP